MLFYKVLRASAQRAPIACRTFTSSTHDLQVHPRGSYYDALMQGTIPKKFPDHAPIIDSQLVTEITSQKASEAPNTPDAKNSSDPAVKELPATDRKLGPQERAKLVFGSPLTGPQRLANLVEEGTVKNGVVIPMKPEEPDNCCMSGCVNCVWDMYQEEMEAYQAAVEKAEAAGKKKEIGLTSKPAVRQVDASASEKKDDRFKEELFGAVPVGIKQFMATEKKLRQQKSMAQKTERLA